MKDIVTYISPLIESQFPSFYREDGQVFITFVKSYYEWLEQANNTLYHSRRLLEYRDVDQTVDDFLVYFKEETLKNIQFDTATNKRLLIKNALDFYRSKGTERSVDLFFKLVYAQPASIRYPGDDVFKLSDNTWKIPIYIEVTETPYNPAFEGKQITGIDSGATAFVDNYSVKKKINDQTDSAGNKVKVSKNIHVFFLSNLKGNFKYGEKVIHTGTTDPRNTPVITGSLNELQVLTGASDYVVGDIVTLTSNTGMNGKAIVTSTFNTTGQVEFLLLEGGWGYTTSPKIIIAEKTLQVNNVVVSNGSLINPFIQFETFVQPKANIDFQGMSGTFQANAFIYNYYPNNALSGYGQIVSIDISTIDTTTGNLYVSVISGNLQSNATLYNTDNTIYANTVTYTDLTATANIVAYTTNNSLILSDIQNGVLVVKGEQVYQSNSTVEWANATVQTISKVGATLIVEISNTQGAFLSNQRINGRSSSANALLSSYSTYIGINDSSTTSVASVTITANGANYSNGEVISFTSTSGYGAYARVTTTAGGNISAVTLVRPGTGYLTTPSATIANSANQYFFNANTDVSNTTDFITLSNHDFVNAQYIQYKVTATNTAISPLINNTKYYVRTANSLGITVSTAPKGNVINITAGATENGHSFTAVVSGGYGAFFTPVLGNAIDYNNGLFLYGRTSNTTAYLTSAGQGSLASFQIASLDDEETVSLNSDFLYSNNIYGADYLNIIIDGSSNTALSGSNAYGFPANPAANLSNGTISSVLAIDDFTIGSISLISKTNPGEDYNLDPLVTVIEPVVYGYKKSDYILTTRENTASFLEGENLLFISRKAFDGKNNVSATNSFISITNNIWANGTVVTYSVDNGNTVIGGLANNFNYYVVQSNTSGLKLSTTVNGSAIVLTPTATSQVGHYIQNGSYSKLGLLKNIIDENTLQVTRTSMFGEIPEYANSYVKGETSQFISMISLAGKDKTFSGLNAEVSANVVTANGAVGSLIVLDSGYGYERFDLSSFARENDPDATLGIAKAIVERQGKGEGFYQYTKGFLSQDKYIHDGDFYQDYSYELVSRVPYERYSEMLKKVLHVAGTKMFPAAEVESSISLPITASRSIELRTSFNPTSNVDVSIDFIRLPNGNSSVLLLGNNDIVSYDVDTGNTAISTSTRTIFNPTANVDVTNDFINLRNDSLFGNTDVRLFSNADIITYSVDAGNSAITGLTSGVSYYVAYANSTGFKLSTTISGSSIVNLQSPLPNEAGHGITYTTGLSNGGVFYVAYANSTGFKLSTTANGANVVNLLSPLPNEVGHGITNIL